MEAGGDGMRRDFLAALKARAAGTQRVRPAPGGKIHALALALGQRGRGGYAPVAGRRQAVAVTRPSRGEVAATVPVGARRPSRDGVPVALPGGVEPPADGPSYRAVVAAAKTEATQKREIRAAERAALRLPVREGGAEARSFAPIPGRPAAFPAPLRQRTATMGWEETLAFRGADAAGGAEAFPPPPALPPAGLARPARQGAPGEWASPAAQDALEAPAPAAFDLDGALDDYFFRMSRMPLSGYTGFDPLLTPTWPGMKLMG
jgi:hypothetical protein